jgi:hypothetical protein
MQKQASARSEPRKGDFVGKAIAWFMMSISCGRLPNEVCAGTLRSIAMV